MSSWRKIGAVLRDGDFSAAGYLLGWTVIGALPPNITQKLFTVAADSASRNGRGMEQLRRNLMRVVGTENVTSELIRDNIRSYARYWAEAFRLPRLVDDPTLYDRIVDCVDGIEHVDASRAAGRGVLIVAPHSGNWDLAGLWLSTRYGGFTTVAERLKPEILFDEFVEFRRTLGFEVLPLTGGEKPFPKLVDTLEHGGIVCLMGERDITHRGIPVEFFGEPAHVPFGPESLARTTNCAVHVAHCFFTPDGWGFTVSEDINPLDEQGNSAVQQLGQGELAQEIISRMADNIRRHPADWHVLQPLFDKDVAAWRARRAKQDPTIA